MAGSGPAGYQRFMLATLLFFGLFVVYTLRVILSIAIEPMQNAYGWDAPTKGLVLSSFFIGCTLR